MYGHIIFSIASLKLECSIILFGNTILLYVGLSFEYLFLYTYKLRCNFFALIQTSYPHICLYLGVNCFTLIGIIYRKPVSFTHNVFPFQNSLRPPSFFDFIKSL